MSRCWSLRLDFWLRSSRRCSPGTSSARCGDCRKESAKYADLSNRAYESFNRRYWYEAGGYLYDVVDSDGGDDASLRPNQLFSFSLSYPVLEPTHWKAVLDIVQQRLLTPYGLRSLAPGSPNYKPQYYGDLPSRDGWLRANAGHLC